MGTACFTDRYEIYRMGKMVIVHTMETTMKRIAGIQDILNIML